MRLLSIQTLQFQDFRVQDAPSYAIASHRWGEDETTYKDFKKRRNLDSAGSQKVGRFCGTVKLMNDKVQTSPAWAATGFNFACEWLWIDTACINKTDSVELSESINSMFDFYRRSTVCYAYLSDVRSIKDYHGAMLDFMQSAWFTRGWTLQELLAPQVVVFLTVDWEVLGHKCSHEKRLCDVLCRGFCQRLDFVVSRITSIPLTVIKDYATARGLGTEIKMAWVQKRETTKAEDLAYCLLGICDVFLVPIYGEGHFAWKRLQAAIAEKETLKEELRDISYAPKAPRSSAPLLPASPSAADYIKHKESPRASDSSLGQTGKTAHQPQDGPIRKKLYTLREPVMGAVAACPPRLRTDGEQQRPRRPSMDAGPPVSHPPQDVSTLSIMAHKPCTFWPSQAMVLPPRPFKGDGTWGPTLGPPSRPSDNWRSNRCYYEAFHADQTGLSVQSWKLRAVNSRTLDTGGEKLPSCCVYCGEQIFKGQVMVMCSHDKCVNFAYHALCTDRAAKDRGEWFCWQCRVSPRTSWTLRDDYTMDGVQSLQDAPQDTPFIPYVRAPRRLSKVSELRQTDKSDGNGFSKLISAVLGSIDSETGPQTALPALAMRY